MTRLAVILALGLGLCAGLTAGPAPAQDAGGGRDHFVTYCAACHGLEGRGDGHMAPILSVLPPDLTRLSADNGGAFPTARVAWQIDGRDPLLAHGGDMPLFGQFFVGDGPDVAVPTDSGQPLLTGPRIAELLGYLQSIQE